MSVRDDQLDTLKVGGKDYDFYRIADLPGIDHLPYSLKVLVENLVRNIDGANITDDHVKALLDWDPAAQPSHEIQFTPSRVVMQDFTGVPCIVDLATMRDAVKDLGGDPEVINPQVQSDMVIDHSVQIDKYGVADAVEQNMDIEYQRNGERYQFLRWGQQAFRNFRVVPPGTGIIHQVNIEYLAKVVMTKARENGHELAYLDSCVGTDSHTTTVNGLGVLGWGVGGIEAEAAMLGQPISMLVPRVVGFKLTGSIPEGVTATDVVLTITDMLRQHGVVGKFVEFYGDGIASVPLDRLPGTRWRYSVATDVLGAVIEALQVMRTRRGGDRLLAYRQGNEWVDLASGTVNAYLSELFGGDFTAKDFRTWHATVIFAAALAAAPWRWAVPIWQAKPVPPTKSAMRGSWAFRPTSSRASMWAMIRCRALAALNKAGALQPPYSAITALKLKTATPRTTL